MVFDLKRRSRKDHIWSAIQDLVRSIYRKWYTDWRYQESASCCLAFENTDFRGEWRILILHHRERRAKISQIINSYSSLLLRTVVCVLVSFGDRAPLRFTTEISFYPEKWQRKTTPAEHRFERACQVLWIHIHRGCLPKPIANCSSHVPGRIDLAVISASYRSPLPYPQFLTYYLPNREMFMVILS